MNWLTIKKLIKKFLLLAFLSQQPVLAAELDFDDDLTEVTFDLDDIDQWENDNVIDYRQIEVPPPILANFLKNIKNPLWNKTQIPAGRDILYLLPHKITAIEYGGIALSYFFNMTNRMEVTFSDFLEIERSNVINFINSIGPNIPSISFSPAVISQLLPLFKKITLQERKTGFLIQGGFVYGPFTFQANTSLQLSERNFWLSPRDQAEAKQLIGEIFGDEGQQFDENELLKIRYGMGDTRLKIGLNTINMTSFQLDLGFEGILPTSSFFNTPRIERVEIDVDDLENTTISSLKAVRDNLINPQLGNNGHFGFGCYIESRIGLFHEMLQLWTRLSYDHLFSAREDRLFMFKQTITPDDLDPGIPDESILREQIKKFFREYVAPSSYSSTVYPGGVVNFVLAGSVDISKRWRYALGYDFYAQGRGRIKKIHDTDTCLEQLRVDNAETERVLQHKVFTEFMYYKKKNNRDIGFGIGGDITVKAKDIGEDWTVYAKFAMSF